MSAVMAVVLGVAIAWDVAPGLTCADAGSGLPKVWPSLEATP